MEVTADEWEGVGPNAERRTPNAQRRGPVPNAQRLTPTIDCGLHLAFLPVFLLLLFKLQQVPGIDLFG
jgi:hypothetical protein